MTKEQAIDYIEGKEQELCSLSDAIWDHPEVKYQEKFASDLLSAYLEKEGFHVTKGVAGIPTAFVAEFGAGVPVIGILAEYDALPLLSQKAECDRKEPVTENAPGHGCGHNLLGVGSVGAAIAVKEYLSSGHAGTVKLFGCPAEEGGSGKTFMARDGVFDGLDSALTWHPGDTNDVATGSNLANCQLIYHYHGKASHAAISPEFGRSALDAVELLNIGVQFLREHMPQECRIHYAITNAGGDSPNVVQPEAEALYLIRAPKLPQVRSLTERVDDIAKGAALMTGTTLERKFIKACSNVLPNRVLQNVMYKNFSEIGTADYDADDFSLAKKMQASMEEKDDYYQYLAGEIEDPELRKEYLADANSPLYVKLLPLSKRENCSAASSDVGDVSWNCPTAQISAVTMPGGTVMHSWQEVAVGKSKLAKKGMLQAAKVIAATAIDLYENPDVIEKAKEELKERTGGEAYHCPIPQGVLPPMNL